MYPAYIRTGDRSRPTNHRVRLRVPVPQPNAKAGPLGQFQPFLPILSGSLRPLPRPDVAGNHFDRRSSVPTDWDRNRFNLHRRPITGDQNGLGGWRRRTSRVAFLDAAFYGWQIDGIDKLYNVSPEDLLRPFRNQQAHAEGIDKNYLVLAVNQNRLG